MKKFLVPILAFLIGLAAGWFLSEVQHYNGPKELGIKQSPP